MGMDLSTTTDNFRFSQSAWVKVLQLASEFGWEPRGTSRFDFANAVSGQEPALDSEWGGGYTTNDLQIITAEDAAALADALERALADITENQRWRIWFHQSTQTLREFIAFARGGEILVG